VNSIDDDELRKDIILDASEGGGIYGIRVVEESVNGPIRAPIYGYYNGTEFEDRWNSPRTSLAWELKRLTTLQSAVVVLSM
jgi:hypothetical protein